MDISYKLSKEAFVSGMTGSSVLHVNALSSVAVASLILHASFKSRLESSLNLVAEWLLLVVPLLLSMTVFAFRPLLLSGFLITLAGTIFLVLPKPPEAPLLSEAPPSSHETTRRHPRIESEEPAAASHTLSQITIRPLPALTVYRSHMMLMTILAILAVDFPIFPRSLAKCETFGVSLMDIGVGSFVFSQGVVSAIPILKDPQRLASPMIPKILTTTKKVLPLLVMGIIRLISVKGTDYPEHESEYGRHWNFFFTMAFVPLLEVFCHKAMMHASISFVGFAIALTHQLALSLTPLQEYTLNASRLDIISSNKEGLVSLLGYLAMHLIGFATGTVLLPASPSEFKRLQRSLRKGGADRSSVNHSSKPQHRQNDKIAIELFSYAALWWIAFGVSSLFNLGGGVSRRLANAPYVLWVCAYNTTFLLCYLLVDMVFYSQISGSRTTSYSSVKKISTPSVLLDAINHNGLVIFLCANVLTGLINFSMRTMYASDTISLTILSLYTFVLCGLAWAQKGRRLLLL